MVQAFREVQNLIYDQGDNLDETGEREVEVSLLLLLA